MTARQYPHVAQAQDATYGIEGTHRAWRIGRISLSRVWRRRGAISDHHKPQHAYHDGRNSQLVGHGPPAAKRVHHERGQGNGQGPAHTIAGLGDTIGHAELLRRKPHA